MRLPICTLAFGGFASLRAGPQRRGPSPTGQGTKTGAVLGSIVGSGSRVAQFVENEPVLATWNLCHKLVYKFSRNDARFQFGHRLQPNCPGCGRHFGDNLSPKFSV